MNDAVSKFIRASDAERLAMYVEVLEDEKRVLRIAQQAITDRWDLFSLCRNAFDLMCNSEAYKGPYAPEHWTDKAAQWAADLDKVMERPQFKQPGDVS